MAFIVLCLAPAYAGQAGADAPAEPRVHTAHGIAMHGEPKYGPEFRSFDYVRPDAPKGGTLKLAALGTFDSFNPYIIKGTAADGLARIYDTLMESSADEPFTEYGLLAETVTWPEDRSWVQFRLRREARWHDGRPVTPEDVVWTFETLRRHGLPAYRGYYAGVARVEVVGERDVKFTFHPGVNRELPLIVGQLPVLPKHYWEGRDFTRPTLEPPLGSGPYRIAEFEPGRFVTYRRVEDYWGRDLPVRRGRDNFDVIRVDYYRDSTVALEAFKAGAYDFRYENSSKDWATSYDFPAVHEGLVKREEVPHQRPAGMQGYVYNTRRWLFRDRRVRAALAFAFDFEWSNAKLFYGQYTRTRSYFDNSELAARGLPSPAERAILEPFRDRLPPEVFGREYNPPRTDGSGNIRGNLRQAMRLLRAAGWRFDPKTQRLTKDGRGFSFEILLVEPLFERVTLPFARNLKRLGIEARVRTVDAAQYENRVEKFDFDMIVASWGQSLSPGNEQRYYWGSEFADQPGSLNLAGIRDPVVDHLIELVISAPDRASLVERVHALDRVLQWGHWVIPHWHIPYDRIAYWDRFGRPAKVPMMGFQLDTWWLDKERAARVDPRRGR